MPGSALARSLTVGRDRFSLLFLYVQNARLAVNIVPDLRGEYSGTLACKIVQSTSVTETIDYSNNFVVAKMSFF